MGKTKHFFIIFTSFFILTFSTNAQDLYFGIGGGGTKLYNDFYTTHISKGGLGFKREEHITFKIKLDPQVLPFRTTGHFSYLTLNSAWEEVNMDNAASSMWIEPSEIEFSSYILSLGLGIEYEIKMALIAPYLLLQMNMNKFSKTSLYISHPGNAVSPYQETSQRSISDEIRYGIGIGIGHEFYATPKYGLDIFLKYDILNFLGKKDIPTTVSLGQNLKENNLKSISITVLLLFKI